MSHRLTECVNDLLSLMRERLTLTIRFACCQTISARDASREDMRCRQRHADETTGRVEEVVGSTTEEWGGRLGLWICGEQGRMRHEAHSKYVKQQGGRGGGGASESGPSFFVREWEEQPAVVLGRYHGRQ